MVKEGSDIVFSDNVFFGSKGEEDVKASIDELSNKAEESKKNLEIDEVDDNLSIDNKAKSEEAEKGKGVDDIPIIGAVDDGKDNNKGGIDEDALKSIVSDKETNIGRNNGYVKLLKNIGIESYVIADGDNEREIFVGDEPLDDDLVSDLIAAHYEAKSKNLKENSVRVDEVSEQAKEVISFIAKGGDPRKLIESQGHIDSVKKYDLLNDEDAEAVIREYHSLKGSDSDEIENYLVGVKARGVLTETAEKCANAIEGYYEKQKDIEKKLLDDIIKEREDSFNEYRKSFKEQIKEYGYSDARAKRITDFALKKVKKQMTNGTDIEDYEMDFMYRQHRADPKKAVRLAFFLLDEENFIKSLMEDKEKEMRRNIINETRVVKVSRSSSANPTSTKFEDNTIGGIMVDFNK